MPDITKRHPPPGGVLSCFCTMVIAAKAENNRRQQSKTCAPTSAPDAAVHPNRGRPFKLNNWSNEELGRVQKRIPPPITPTPTRIQNTRMKPKLLRTDGHSGGLQICRNPTDKAQPCSMQLEDSPCQKTHKVP